MALESRIWEQKATRQSPKREGVALGAARARVPLAPGGSVIVLRVLPLPGLILVLLIVAPVGANRGVGFIRHRGCVPESDGEGEDDQAKHHRECTCVVREGLPRQRRARGVGRLYAGRFSRWLLCVAWWWCAGYSEAAVRSERGWSASCPGEWSVPCVCVCEM